MNGPAAVAGRPLRRWRLFGLLLVAIALAPGTWVRPPPDWRFGDDRQILILDRLRIPADRIGEVEVAGAWALRSTNRFFGGYSALVAMGDGTLLAVTDGSRKMRLRPPGSGTPAVEFGYFATLTQAQQEDKRLVDLEGATRDPASGRFWASYEATNQIERYDADLAPTGRVRPPEMRGWSSNTGAESIVRLADGRFAVLSEGNPRWFAAGFPALLFADDPVEGTRPERFSFRAPAGFRPVDMAPLPDGRVVILLRTVHWGLPPRFEGKLLVADPAEIRPGVAWAGRIIADLKAPLPMDNYEGVAVEPGADGEVVLWVISDDNHAKFQRTLLLKLVWRPDEKARGRARAPR